MAERSALAGRLELHVRALASEHRIEIVEKPGASPRAVRVRIAGVWRRRIVIRPIRGRSSYFTALHELGHHLAPQPRLRLEQEVVAWRWALEHANAAPTPGVWLKISRCLESYVRRAELWKSMKLPGADHDFWRLLAEARAQLAERSSA